MAKQPILVHIEPDVIGRIDAQVGKLKRSQFIREAIDAFLEGTSWRRGAAPVGLPDSTLPPTPRSREQVDAVAPAREVAPAPAAFLAPEFKPVCDHPRALPGMRTCPQCFAVLVSE